MAVALPQTQAELDALKANLGAGYGAAAGQVRQRDPAIQAAYDQVSAQIRGDAATRAGRDAATATAETNGMASAAQSLGIAPVSLPNSRASRVAGALRQQYTGDAEGWGTFLGGASRFARDRNSAQAGAFDEQGRQAQADLDYDFQQYLYELSQMGGGGGGGGGRGGGGGGGYDDEALIEFGDPPTMTEGGIRGLAGTSRRLTQKGNAYQSAGLVSADGRKWLGGKTGVPTSPGKAQKPAAKPAGNGKTAAQQMANNPIARSKAALLKRATGGSR